MQWDLLRSFEAVARLGSLTAASRALGVSQSTISRQLARLEEDARSPLLLRSAPIRLTERGEALLTTLAPMLDAARAAEAALEASPELHGQVTVTTVGELTAVIRTCLPCTCRRVSSWSASNTGAEAVKVIVPLVPLGVSVTPLDANL